ncbi:hypothetical protein JW935_19350 [candidate division KSB1 bacterium]|nr:hypothetical protein [candidate division KSB1 bacterium]
MKKIIILLFFIFSIVASAQIIHSYSFDQPKPPVPGLAGNGITDIAAGNGIIWFGTGHGLSRTTDSGRSFQSLGTSHGLGRGSVSAIWVSGDSIWVATAGDTLTKISDDYLPIGTGLSVSTDGGNTWQHFSQPPDDYTSVQNLSYDIAVHKGTVWSTNFGGGLVRSDDWGQSWQIAPPDSFVFEPGTNLNHRAFSVVSAGDALYAGTAAGINKSTDNGKNWINFSHTNQKEPISGNFVVALALQKYNDKKIIWAATWKAEDDDEYYAVSCSDNGGVSWKTMLEGEKAHNFCFDDSVVFVATDNGLFKSVNNGSDWYVYPRITDAVTGTQILSYEIYSAYYHKPEETLWVGTADGLAATGNNGYTWKVNRAFVATGKGDAPRTYAYPNPFSPLRHNLVDSDGYVRIQYNVKKNTHVTIKIFDFAMDLVTTVTDHKFLVGPTDGSEIWNGRNDFGDLVANGVYFYSVDVEDDGVFWGKIMIVN